MDIAGATLAAAAMRAGLIDEYAIVTHPVLVGGGTPFFTALDTGCTWTSWRPGRFPTAWC
jgi:riboflavin biosynthesis pyrimidine reductase